MMRHVTAGIIGAASLGLAALDVKAEDARPATMDVPPVATIDDKGIFTLNFENDIFTGSDRNYTNGVRAAYLSPEGDIPVWMRYVSDNFLPLSNNGKKRVSFAVGQSMFTPDDLSQTGPIPGDRPYAGWLYTSVGLLSDNDARLDNLQLTFGMIGPASGAEPTQKFVHKLIDSPDPKGWDNNQLDNELGVNIAFERKWRGLYEFSPFGVGVDASPHVGFNLGNVNTDVATGMTFRLGYDLPSDYGPPRIRPSLPGSDFFIPTKELGGYLFAGVEGRAVARNIFLDGNTFHDGPSVDKEPFVGSLQAGVAVTYGETRLAYTHVLMTREFEGQSKPASFGAVSLSWRF